VLPPAEYNAKSCLVANAWIRSRPGRLCELPRVAARKSDAFLHGPGTSLSSGAARRAVRVDPMVALRYE